MAASPPAANRVLIVAHSGRALAEAAVLGGWSPWVIDQFADQDTVALADAVVRLASDTDYSFDAQDLLNAIAAVQEQAGPMPLILASGFESRPELAAMIAGSHRICGCGIEVLQALVDTPEVFGRLRRMAEASVPMSQHERPAEIDGWLGKRVGGCGGSHVHRLSTSTRSDSGYYYQRYIEGQSMSALMIAGRSELELCGVAEHVSWYPNAGASFRYEGAHMLARPPRTLMVAAETLGAYVVNALGVIGCFGIDFIWRGGGELVLVDINPRPTATLSLYPDMGAIFTAHMAACTTGELLYSRPPRAELYGHLILYADASWIVPEGIEWPNYVADQPVPGTCINRDAPLCTLRARATPGTSIMAELTKKYDHFFALISRYQRTVLPRSRTIRTMGDHCHV